MSTKTLVPVSSLLTDIFPSEWIDPLGDALRNIGVEIDSYCFEWDSSGLRLSCTLYVLSEAKFDFPLIPGSHLEFEPDESFSGIGFQLLVSYNSKIEISDVTLRLTFNPEMLPAYDKNTSGIYEIVENPLEEGQNKGFAIDVNFPRAELNFSGDIQIDTPEIGIPYAAMIGDTGIVIDFSGGTGAPLDFILSQVDISSIGSSGEAPILPVDFRGVRINHLSITYQKPDTAIPPLSFINFAIGNAGVWGEVYLGTPPASDNIELSSSGLSALFNDSGEPGSESPSEIEEEGGSSIRHTVFPVNIFGMKAAFQYFGIGLVQNIPQWGTIKGFVFVPFADKWVSLKATIGGPDADFMLEIGGTADEPLINIEHELFEIKTESLAYELRDEVHFAVITGSIRPKIEGFDWPEMKVNRLSISSKGDIDIPGGWLKAPEEITLDFHAFKIGIGEIGFGTEGEDAAKRQWLGFSGSISLVEGIPLSASVEGLKFSWLKEPIAGDRGLKVSLSGIGVELEIPNVLKFDGSVSYREIGTETSAAGEASASSGSEIAPGGLTGHLFTGSINLDLMPLKTEIDAQLIIGELTDIESGQSFKVFYIALQASLPVGIPLGPTLSIYELQGLFGVHVAPHRKMVDGEPEPWYAWYKAEPEYNVTSIEKWWPQFDHYAFGAGLMLGTGYDEGFSLNVGALVAVLIPGPVVMIEGRANFLKQRGDRTSEGALYMLAVFDGIAQSFQLNIDINYSLEGIVDVTGGLEALFFFSKEKAHLWHIYIGQREPETKRMRAQVITIVSASTYLMIDNYGIQFGAKAGVDWSETYGPVEVALKLIFEFYAGIFWKRTQFEGMIRLHGEITLKLLGIGLQLILELMLEGKTPDPFYIYGLARIAVKLPFPLPSFDVKAEFSWGREDIPEYVRHLKTASMTHHKAKSLSWELASSEAEAPVVPVDAVPVLLFAKPIRSLSEVLAEERPDAERIPYEFDEVAGWRFSYRHPDIKLEIKGDDGSYDNPENLIKQSPLRVSDIGDVTPFDITLLPDSLAQEPKLQLWHHAPLDYTNKYEREDYEAGCVPSVEPEIICVTWLDTPNRTYPLEFIHQQLNFIVALEGYRTAASAYRGELRTPSIWVRLPEMVDHLEIRFSISLQFGLPRVIPYKNGIALRELALDRISANEARVFSDGELYDAVQIIAGDPVVIFPPGIPGGGGGVVDPGGGGPGGDEESGMTVISQICYRLYSQTELRQEVGNSVNPHNPTQYKNELMLQPNSQYRLTVTTYIDYQPVEGHSDRETTNEVFYFSTGDLPGSEYTDGTVDFADKQPNDLSTYIEASIPGNGANTFYYDYDVSVRFTDSYVEQLYQGTLAIRLRNQNDKLLGSAANNWYVATWIPILTPGLLTLLNAKDSIECDVEWQPQNPRYLYSIAPEDHELGPNRLYKGELVSSRVTRTDDTPLYAFEFVTSNYASFTEHMQSGLREVERVSILRVQTLPGTAATPTAWLADHTALSTALYDARSRLADYVTERVTATAQQIADAIAEAKEAGERLKSLNSETFAAIDAAVQPLFDSIGMQPRPLPPNLELVKVALTGGGYLLLLHSPEPMDFSRTGFSLVLEDDIVEVSAVWNEDQTQVYFVKSDGSGFATGSYLLTATYQGGGVDRAELAPISQGGTPVDERIDLPMYL